MRSEIIWYDEITANKKYTEGLVCYVQGKYYEAERYFGLTLKLNPNHKKWRRCTKT
ncbi:MAG: tetratricopeptide repeat protein [Endomicrobium sp.]|nr:tetratricopeptide repeat protein [Endomicrobium sp.]